MARRFPLGRPRSWSLPSDGWQRRGQLLIAVAVACLLVVAVAAPGSADDEGKVREKRRSVSGQIGGAKASLDQSSKALSRAAGELDTAQTNLANARATLTATRGRLATARAQDATMAAKLQTAEGQLDTARTTLKQGRKKLKRAERDVKRFTLESLESGDPGLRAFSGLLRGEDPSSFSEQMALNDSVGDAQLAQMDTYDASRVMLELNERRVEKLRDSVKAQRVAAAENLDLQEELEAAQVTQTTKVAALVGTAQQAERTAATAKADDIAELNRLESERTRLSNKLKAIAAREREAARRAAEAKRRQRSGGGGGGNSDSGGDTGGAGDAADGGSALSRPSGGPITSPYGMRFHPILRVWKLHDGTDFGIPCGTPVRAAASGRVIEKYFNGGYGNRLILAHGQMRGKSIATTYNHLSSYTVRIGERVKRGEVIAYSGTTGYSTGCHLHFMVLADGETVNPMNWL